MAKWRNRWSMRANGIDFIFIVSYLRRFCRTPPPDLRVNKTFFPIHARTANHFSIFMLLLIINFTNLILFFLFIISIWASLHYQPTTFNRTESAWMKMTANEKRMAEREALRSVIQQWNANRLDLFELSEPDEVNPFVSDFDRILSFYFNILIHWLIPFRTTTRIHTHHPHTNAESTIPWRDEILFSRSWTKSSDKMYTCGIGRHRFGRDR